MTTDELIRDLRDHARIHWNGKMGSECVVDKSLLSEAADRLEELSSAPERMSPCDVCMYDPPSSCDGKPCCICPAAGRVK